MDGATTARIQEWDQRPVSDGYGGLGELANANFTGAVTSGAAWLFMLNGRIVGTVDGPVSAFKDGDATAYTAPDPGLPLLYTMQAEGGEPRAKYYTDDNPLPDVHETLVEASFTGYIELAENVLSGDYYVVYYGGKSMSLAFVGNSEQLVTGDEAFREAADEVGIYEVVDIELDVRNVPQPSGAETGADTNSEPEPELDSEPAAPSAADAPVADDTKPEAASPEPEPTASSGSDRAEATPESSTATTEPPSADGSPAESAATSEEQPDPFSEEAAWRETRTIPALDPDESGPARETGAVNRPSTELDVGSEPETEATSTPEPDPEESDDDRIGELEAAIEAQSETIAKLESRLDSSSEEIKQLRQERNALESELESTRVDGGGGETEATSTLASLERQAALNETDLFVRYDSQGDGTLEKAHDGTVDREEVLTNLRIDHHTRFDATGVAVEGQQFEEFLGGSLEYRFVHWLVTELLFEIQETGSQRGLRDVFVAIPRIDRAEFHAEVTWRDQAEGKTISETFDVVCRDRMGQPLIVANLNDVRDPATAEMMETLIESTSTIAEGSETLGGAFLVTSSFFRPEALETAGEATGGGLLSREKRLSYVKLNRNRGYHLCLVEARDDDCHVAVPEL